MWPHVYADVTEDMECFHEEIFGPVITIVKAKDFDHALHLANASPYGLSSAIYAKMIDWKPTDIKPVLKRK